MPENLKIDTPIGEITIPYSEEAILNFYTKLVKASEGDPNLLEEAFVEYMDLSSPDDAVSDWLFWEDTRTPINIYDFMGWVNEDFDVDKTLGFTMGKTKITGLQYHQFTYPHGQENMPIRATFFLSRKTDGAKFVVDMTPVDGLHIEVQIIHQPSTQIKTFHESFKDYRTKNSILKNKLSNY